MIFAYLTVQTGSIWPAVLIHFLTNATSVCLEYAGLFLPDTDAQGMLNGTAFAVMAVIGIIGAAILWAGHREGDTAKTALLRPIGNGFSRFTVGRRAGLILTAPAMVIGLIGLVLMTVLNIVAS